MNRFPRHPRLPRSLMAAGLAGALGLLGAVQAHAGQYKEEPWPQRLMVGPVQTGGTEPAMREVGEVLRSRQDTRALLALFTPACKEGTFAQCVESFAATTKGLPGLSSGHAMQLLFLVRSLYGEDGESSIGELTGVTVTGTIRRQCPAGEHGGSPGYRFDARMPYRGTQGVMCVQTTTTVEGAGGTRTLRQLYKVLTWPFPTGFGIDRRNGADPGNVFPAAAYETGIQVQDTADNHEFLYKLYARGTFLRVVEYWERRGSGGSWDKYDRLSAPRPPGSPRIFDIDDDACIDMMFEDFPPVTLSGETPPFYCLGRCSTPRLVNTM